MAKDCLMIEDLAKNLIHLKKNFVNTYDGKSQIQEVIPLSTSDLFPIPKQNLDLLHQLQQ